MILAEYLDERFLSSFFKGRLFEKNDVNFHFTYLLVNMVFMLLKGILSVNSKVVITFLDSKEHISRLINSCKALSIKIDYSEKDIIKHIINYIHFIKPEEDCLMRVSIFLLRAAGQVII